MSNRIRYWRKRRKLTLERLAERLGTSAGHLHKWETGKVAITLTRLDDVAEALGCTVYELIEGGVQVPVVGRIGPGGVVSPVDRDPPHLVRCPLGADREKTEALVVTGDAMIPMEDGWLLFYTRNGSGVPVDCLGKLCVARLAEDGTTYVKRVKLSHRPGLFNLYGPYAREIEDVALEWAAVVVDARPADPDEIIEG